MAGPPAPQRSRGSALLLRALLLIRLLGLLGRLLLLLRVFFLPRLLARLLAWLLLVHLVLLVGLLCHGANSFRVTTRQHALP